MDYKDRIKLFKNELNLFIKKDVLDFTKACISIAPDYVFYDCPSSSSGKYHPIDELGGDGTIIHTRRVFTLAYDYSRMLDVEQYRDEICSAALLHDLAKQGLDSYGHTVSNHPQIMANLVADLYNTDFKDRLDKTSANIIYWAIFYHYGPWTIQKHRKPMDQFSRTELAVYIADYTASKKFVSVDHRKKVGLST